jgi:hypothetical protein
LVLVRGFDGSTKIEHGEAYLFLCPHVQMRHKRIGKDTLRSKPLTRTDLVPTGFYLRQMGASTDNLAWTDYEIPLHHYQRMQIAELLRDQWETILYL